jgi:hypothetical protein
LMFLLLFQIGIFLLVFCKCERSSKFMFFKPNLEGEIFFSIFVCWWIFLIIHVFEKWWLTMCLFVVCKNYLDIIHSILHIAFHLYNCIVYFFSTLHLLEKKKIVQFCYFLTLKINIWDNKICNNQYAKIGFENWLVSNVWELVLWNPSEIIFCKFLKPCLGL